MEVEARRVTAAGAPLQCKLCGKHFQRACNLRQHQNRIHPAEPPPPPPVQLQPPTGRRRAPPPAPLRITNPATAPPPPAGALTSPVAPSPAPLSAEQMSLVHQQRQAWLAQQQLELQRKQQQLRQQQQDLREQQYRHLRARRATDPMVVVEPVALSQLSAHDQRQLEVFYAARGLGIPPYRAPVKPTQRSPSAPLPSPEYTAAAPAVLLAPPPPPLHIHDLSPASSVTQVQRKE